LPFLSALVLLPFYSNRLSTGDFGLLNVYISLALLAQVLTTLGVDQYIPVLVNNPDHSNEQKKKLLSHAYGFQLIYGLLFAGVLMLLGKFILGFVYSDDTLQFWPYGALSVLTGFFNGYFRTQTTLLTFEENVKTYAIFNIINFVLTIALSLIFLDYYGPSIYGPMLGRLLSGAVIFGLSLWYQFRHTAPSAATSGMKEVMSIGMVMFVYSLMMWVLSYFDRFVLTGWCTLEEVAIYDFCTKCLLPLEFLQMGLSGFLLPRLYKSFNGNFSNPGMSKANTLLHSFMVVSVVGLIGTMIFIPIVGPIFIKNAALFDSFELMGLMGIGFLVRGLFILYMGVLMLRKEAARLVKSLFFSSVIQIGLLIPFVSGYGVYGAIIAILLGKIISVALLRLEIKSRITLAINPYKLIVYPALISGMLVIAFFVQKTFGYYTTMGVVGVSSIFLSWFFFRRDIGKAREVLFGKD
jgi:O-antigen/teichoic acid export membrane protein